MHGTASWSLQDHRWSDQGLWYSQSGWTLKIHGTIRLPNQVYSQLSANSMMAWWSVSWPTVNPLNPSYWSTESSRVVSRPQRCSVKISAMLSDAFRDCELGIVIRYSADGKLFNPRRMQAVTKVRKTVLRNFLFADDCTINTRNEQEMQAWMDRFFLACNNFGLTISTKKT